MRAQEKSVTTIDTLLISSRLVLIDKRYFAIVIVSCAEVTKSAIGIILLFDIS